jgi:cell division protein ZapA (FtsZ GTPase activity inhibitor)
LHIEMGERTEEARVRGHVGALQHLRKATKGLDDALQHLEGGLRTVVELIR